MENHTIFSLFLNIPYFFLSIFLAFYVPGSILLNKYKLTSFQKTVLAIGLGIVLWGWQGILFGYLNIRWLSYAYLVLIFSLWLRTKPRFFVPQFTIDPIAAFIIFLGVLIQTSVVWQMGLQDKNGLYFCCGAIGDFIYHLGLTDQIINRIPPFEQDMIGVIVRNYHYWGNLVVAELVRVFRLPFVFTGFQYMGFLLSLLLGLSVVVFGQVQNVSKQIIRWLLFFLYFGGDFIYFIILFTRRVFDLSMGPLENGAAFLNNPPRAFAVVLFFIGLSFLSLWLKKKDFKTGILMALILGSTIGFKVYIGIFALTGLGVLGVYYLLKKNLRNILPLLFAVIFALIVYVPVNKSSGGMVFTGFWRAEEFIVQPALGLSHLELARQIFHADNKLLRVLILDLWLLFLFILGIFGAKLLGLMQTKKSLAKLPLEFHIFLIPSLFVSLIAGLFFWQESGGSNSFNFLVSVYIIGSIYTAFAVSYWAGKLHGSLKYAIIFLIIAVNLPRIYYEGQKTFSSIIHQDGYRITLNELEAMEFMKNNTPQGSIVLTSQVKYHPFIAKRNMFLGDYRLLGSHDVDTSKRENIVRDIFTNTDQEVVHQLLKKNNIHYIYVPVSVSLTAQNTTTFLRQVFKNQDIQILKVQ